MPNTDTLVLGSASPQRKFLLERVGITPQILIPNIEETIPSTGSPAAKVIAIARQKFAALRTQNNFDKSAWILCADTLVFHKGRALGKAESQAEAESFLASLSDSWHSVYTGVCIAHPGHFEAIHLAEKTSVHFRKLSKNEIHMALSFGDWREAAGAYRIQGFASSFIDEIRGCPSNVIGLPIARICGILAKNQFQS